MRRTRGDKEELNGFEEIARRQDWESVTIKILLCSNEEMNSKALMMA